jgi:hypothetical protein
MAKYPIMVFHVAGLEIAETVRNVQVVFRWGTKWRILNA